MIRSFHKLNDQFEVVDLFQRFPDLCMGLLGTTSIKSNESREDSVFRKQK